MGATEQAWKGLKVHGKAEGQGDPLSSRRRQLCALKMTWKWHGLRTETPNPPKSWRWTEGPRKGAGARRRKWETPLSSCSVCGQTFWMLVTGWVMSWLLSFWLKHHLSFTRSRTERLLDLGRSNISRGRLWVAGSEVLSSYFNIYWLNYLQCICATFNIL